VEQTVAQQRKRVKYVDVDNVDEKNDEENVEDEESEGEIEDEESEGEIEVVVDGEDNDMEAEDVEQVSDKLIIERENDLQAIYLQDSDLEDWHRGEIPATLVVKSDSTWDLLTIYSDHIFVNVEVKKKLKNKKGRWCLIQYAGKCDNLLHINGSGILTYHQGQLQGQQGHNK
jgi:hypothetical protein